MVGNVPIKCRKVFEMNIFAKLFDILSVKNRRPVSTVEVVEKDEQSKGAGIDALTSFMLYKAIMSGSTGFAAAALEGLDEGKKLAHLVKLLEGNEELAKRTLLKINNYAARHGIPAGAMQPNE